MIMVALGGQGMAASSVNFESHRIQITLDVPAHTALIGDSGVVALEAGWNKFSVSHAAEISAFTVSGKRCDYIVAIPKDSASLPDEIRTDLVADTIAPSAKLIFFKGRQKETTSFTLNFKAVFQEDVANVRFSREAVGNEVSGTILDQGAYLSSSAFFYPQGSEELAKYSVTADIPVTWESVSDGNRIASEIKGDRKVQVWANSFSSDGCVFMAAPYVARSATVGSTEIVCLFFEADTGLVDNYLKATSKYISMYTDLIGTYPFSRFTVAENFFPTGDGMPGWTLLGQSVLRLPFIISSSLGHEVLHNWWGNSVYVDYERGNWCEGMTVYGADYRYKLAESPAAAREYRKDILKQYVSYVSKDKDFPIRQFTSRTSPNTRTIGYNKAMMVIHMIEEEIGSTAFDDAWKLVYQKYVGQKISWEELIAAFTQASGKDLSYVIPQWIDRTGAPLLGLEFLGRSAGKNAGTEMIHLKISEKSGSGYRLRVPVRVEGSQTAVDTTVVMESGEVLVDMLAPAGSKSVGVDPEYHLFRRLYPEEVEPIISAVIGAPTRAFVTNAISEEERGLFKSFGDNLSEDTIEVISEMKLDSLSRSVVPVLMNPSALPEYLANRIRVTPDSITVAGSTYSRPAHTLAVTGQTWNGFEKYMVILSSDAASLPRLGQLIPHYGKYSYLVFEGAKNIAKGQWEIDQSPLRVAIGK